MLLKKISFYFYSLKRKKLKIIEKYITKKVSQMLKWLSYKIYVNCFKKINLIFY